MAEHEHGHSTGHDAHSTQDAGMILRRQKRGDWRSRNADTHASPDDPVQPTEPKVRGVLPHPENTSMELAKQKEAENLAKDIAKKGGDVGDVEKALKKKFDLKPIGRPVEAPLTNKAKYGLISGGEAIAEIPKKTGMFFSSLLTNIERWGEGLLEKNAPWFKSVPIIGPWLMKTEPSWAETEGKSEPKETGGHGKATHADNADHGKPKGPAPKRGGGKPKPDAHAHH